MKNRCFLLFSLLLFVLSSGCATHHPTIGAWRSGGFSPARTDTIALTLRPHPSAEDAQLGRLLTAELNNEGFNLVPQAEADYTLAYVVEDDSTETELPQRDFTAAAPPQTTRDIIVQGTQTPPGFQKATPGVESSLGPQVVVYHNKGIRLFLYTNPQTHSGNFSLAWSGCIEAGESVPADRELLLIKTLLGYFGQDYNSTVDLNK